MRFFNTKSNIPLRGIFNTNSNIPVRAIVTKYSKFLHTVPQFKYIFSKKIIVLFKYTDLYSFESFKLIIDKHLDFGDTYIGIIKIKYEEDIYKMTGKSFAFNYNKDLFFLFDLVNQGLIKLSEIYGYTSEDIVYIQIILRKIDKKFLSDIQLDKHTMSNKTYNYLKKTKLFPLNDINVLENPLDNVIIDDNGYVSNLFINYKDTNID